MLTPSLLFSLSGVMLDRATDLAMTVALDLIWTVALTVAGMVGCVVLVEPGQSLPRAWRLLSPHSGDRTGRGHAGAGRPARAGQHDLGCGRLDRDVGVL
nr:hypothetical protein GCM10020092_067370 [Actinoplanes digitatis]